MKTERQIREKLIEDIKFYLKFNLISWLIYGKGWRSHIEALLWALDEIE